MVEWRTILSFPDYEASSAGQIRRCRSERFSIFGKPLSTHRDKKGYVHLGIWLSDVQRTKTVQLNRLICEAFHGPAPSGDHHAAHWDGNKDNNCAENLRWATRTENEEDKIRHGTSNQGERNGSAKMTEEDVRQIRSRWSLLPRSSGGARIKKGAVDKIAADLGVSRSAIAQAVRGVCWRHIT